MAEEEDKAEEDLADPQVLKRKIIILVIQKTKKNTSSTRIHSVNNSMHPTHPSEN